MKDYRYVSIFDYVYNTVTLGLMTSKNETEAKSYVVRQLEIAGSIIYADIRLETISAINAARSNYNSVYSRSV